MYILLPMVSLRPLEVAMYCWDTSRVSVVRGSPLEKLTPGRSLKIQIFGASAFHSTARDGTTAPLASRAVRVS
jgi:hypothetical protein